jgi:6-pyruvoyltetrahydropterin/6-carboxytetrahydropterin synthase
MHLGKQLKIIGKNKESEKVMTSYITIDGWRANIRFSSAHIIHEYDKCGRLHGHTYAVHTKIFGEPDDKGIIVDFSLLKNSLRELVGMLDHSILIPEKSSILKIEKQKESVKLSALGKTFVFPKSDCVFLPVKSTSAENLASYILERLLLKIKFLGKIETVEIGVDEGYGQGACVSKRLRK